MDTELGDLLELFQQAENQASFIESTLHVVAQAGEKEGGENHVGIVVARLASDVRVIKKLLREIKKAATAAPTYHPLVVVKSAR